MARRILRDARTGALGTLAPDASPVVTRVAVAWLGHIGLVALMSGLAMHTRNLSERPSASLLLEQEWTKGDPMNQPRLSLSIHARTIDRMDARHPDVREGWLNTHRKSRLWVDFDDFRFVTLGIRDGFLNGGFGIATHLSPTDMGA